MSEYYVRFGNIPKDFHSKVYKSDEVIRTENGISVWDCVFINDVPFPLLPDNVTQDGLADYFYCLLGNKPVYLVTGTKLLEKGSANEPLLDTDISIVKEVTKDYEYLKSILHRNRIETLPDDYRKFKPARKILESIEYLQQRVSFANHIGEEYVDCIETNKINLAIEGLEELLKIKYNETSF